MRPDQSLSILPNECNNALELVVKASMMQEASTLGLEALFSQCLRQLHVLCPLCLCCCFRPMAVTGGSIFSHEAHCWHQPTEIRRLPYPIASEQDLS